ncbi:hypothetical protein OSH11_21550 [Kaistia dalseonensis]|uniref:Uncharacterized protein n=1 Tax=Kaistia dalseonensis TaxID=410840 RepID=A0ABU0HEN2_9HYPH|nr:hypothetical protein [Kaistia dalseonensis]MCX5497297.1 hypothetical protein [Kaistia dalseonensis]MDQ0439934.1 hypothetical protein [Kaistia dalseonensis]
MRAANIERTTEPLANAGQLKWVVTDLYEEAGEIVLTLKLSSTLLAAEVFGILEEDLVQDDFRLGSLNLRQEG